MTATRVLVTGGAGFIGSALCRSHLADGHDVVCLDNLSSGRARNVSALRDDDAFTFLEGDVRDGITAHADGGFDYVYHLASRASPTDFEEHPLDIAETNATGTRRVLDFAREDDARVLYASTSEVYGNPLEHPQRETYNGNVDPRGTRACYDEGKRYGEMLAATYARRFGVDTRTARLFNTYGPRMRPDDGRVIPNFLRQALADDPITVYGDGSQTRSFLYVDDQVRGLRALMEAPDLAGEVVNIGSTDEVTIETLAETVLDAFETASEITYEPLPHENDPERRKPDVTRAREWLDWTPDVGLREGLRLTAEHFRAHEAL
ncbi:NAD-dependent epimerase/dehydratase family protein [Halarchaeum sp. CBA1220]|uniref:NAD-dependent epimerase/dehydratase family protein n=1 Tax=Halarchaeum sp. CBA1220 TaxID=1853682 RepID=UPI000F3A9465|nr:NAD-dependent epimerase/dehydratase family protein [Halarchaeum sp. CBA1220]QLC34404.1 NAD-dependent epimerase/dehydratase family protein [Halarchaeum sp. CBA1220]